ELTVNTFVSTGLANIPNQVDNGIFTINPEDTCTCDFCFDLEEGWNMVSIPKTIDTLQQSNIANDLFDLANDEVCLYYNASPDCPDMDRWEQNPEIVPCQGYFVFKNDPYQVCAHFLVEGTGSPPTQEIFVGWNLIGHVDIVPRPVEQFLFATGLDDVRQLWHRSVDGSWEGYPWDGLTEVTQAHGYWAYSNSDDEMAGTLYCP
ncbi:MAG: hypothetical protein MIO93_14250, partial [ANME-2 cluster archaeon]|nr:hypothetical protein [ANME-2 cluster archaeon]